MITESHDGMILAGETEELGENLPHCYFAHANLTRTEPGSNLRPLGELRYLDVVSTLTNTEAHLTVRVPAPRYQEKCGNNVFCGREKELCALFRIKVSTSLYFSILGW
jgi:hypothetical protein